MEKHCLFCQIARAETQAHEIFRNNQIVAFLDNAPIRLGHIQIIPRQHFDYFEQLPSETMLAIVELGQRIAVAQKKIFQANRVAFMFTGGDIPHAHAHVVPLMHKHDVTSQAYIKETNLTFESAPMAEDGELERIANRLANEL